MSESYFQLQPPPDEIEQRIQNYPSWLEIDLDNITHNLQQIRKRVHPAEIIPCVKTNAYGHGIVPIVAHMTRSIVKRVLVAKLWEANQLREAGLDCGIINMDPVFTTAACEEIVQKEITQTVFNASTAERISEAAMRLGRRAGVFVKVDTGLGRVGVRHEEAAGLIDHVSSLPKIRVEGMFSTFSEDKTLDRLQLDRMLAVDAELRRRGIDPGTRSMSSSNAVFHFPDSHLDAVRPGLMIYGIYPEEPDKEAGINLRQALSFKARIEHVKWINEGESLTYSRRFVAPKRMRVGTVHVGYSDGYPRELTNKGLVNVGGTVKPVLGSVSVNHHIVDLDGTSAEVGDVVELVSREGENTLERVSALAGIEPYKFCVCLNPLTPRVYVEGGRPVALGELKLVDR